MLSKISLFNKELVKQMGRGVGWIGLFYFVSLIFILPMYILMTYSEERIVYHINNDGLFYFNFDFQLLLMTVVPILLAVFLLRFLHQKKLVDLIHSLPISRSTLFHQHTLGGLALLILPVIGTGLLIFILYFTLDLQTYFTTQDIFIWMGITILFNSVFFLVGVFVGVLTGISFVQGILAYILLFFPVGVLVLLFLNLSYVVHGFPRDYLINEKIEHLSPLLYLWLFNKEPISWSVIISYILVALVAFTLSLYIYKIRKLEMASQAIAFTKLKSIFKFGTTFCTMLLGGMYFGEVQGNIGWIIFGYCFGAFLGYFVAEMVLLKTWRVFTRIKGWLIYVGTIVVLAILTPITFSSYENNIPEMEEIKNVKVSEYYIHYSNTEYTFTPKALTGKEIITAVLYLHEKLIDDKIRLNNGEMDSQPIFIEYELVNGKKLSRQYSINKEDYYDALKKVYESEEYKKANNEVFHIDEKEVDKIIFTPTHPVNKNATITNPKEIKEMILLLKKEILSEKYEGYRNVARNNSSIDLMLNNKKSVYLEFKPTYQEIENWLRNKELLEDATVTSEDIGYVLVSKQKDLGLYNLYEYDSETIADEMKKHPNTIKITMKENIKECLETIYRWEMDDSYVVAFYYEKEEVFDIKTFSNKETPNFLKEKLK